eukprot:CAMPEP_0181215508 /NCGR_PEP_ID=MMETSP1096-20121128/26053_1 /TAXON_ID=156174 ORGANISM="Chrysochromulina ericina, Strain CCMP281" /NCGR_SAMPLE_ID=MMETSP1096 /ASSEMBLY_ACC=CAM_ASM_000453 /LENGTH=93 /DNA_ID=CAMNT_0023307373 /DNA_START=15 /DNA_END=296 /DNA_ORIENTATION=+
MTLKARSRLATVMTLSRVPRSCSNALPLWRAVLAATKRCVPPNWPHLLEPLRGGIDAARVAGDMAAAAQFEEELAHVLQVLNPACSDVNPPTH